MKKMGLLNFDDLYKEQCLMLTHDCIYNKAPNKIIHLIHRDQPSGGIALRNHTQNPLNLKIPNLKTKAGTNSFCVKGPAILNETANELKTIKKRESFKKSVKTFFLSNYEHKSNCNNPRCRDKKHHY